MSYHRAGFAAFRVFLTLGVVIMANPSLAETDLFQAAGPAPKAASIPRSRVVNGVTLVDQYGWLEDKTDKKVLAHLKAENSYFDKVTAPTKALRNTLYREMRARVVEDDTSVPVKDGAFFYAWRTAKEQEYRDLVRFSAMRDGQGVGPGEVVLDVNALAKGQSYYRVAGYAVTQDGTKIAWLANTTGSLKSDLKIKVVATGAEISHEIKDAADIFWSPGGHDLYVTHQDAAERTYRLDRYGLASGEHQILAQEDDGEFSLGAGLSSDKSMVLIESRATDTSEIRLMDPAHPLAPAVFLSKRRNGHLYSADVADGQVFIETDDQGLNGRIALAPLDSPEESNWVDLIPKRQDVAITGLGLFKNHLVLSTRRDGRTEIEIFNRTTKERHTIRQDEAVYTIATTGNLEYDTTTLRFSYSSFTSAGVVYDYDMNAKTRTELKRVVVPGGFDPDKYVAERIIAKGLDGTAIPISLVHRKDVTADGTRPTFLYVYGAYGIPMNPGFSNSVISMLDRGMVYALAHVRGGGDQGRGWHHGGRLGTKVNTFTDTNAAAEALIAAGWTKPNLLALEGRSAGGLTLGAALNLRPDLYRVAHLGVPFVDVINTMLDPSVPLTTGEYREWGNPNEAEAFKRILAYSPYDNLAARQYPALLVTTGINDMQVRYSEPTKYVAKLRALNPKAQAVMRVNMGVGHGGASGRYKALDERAQELAYLLWMLGYRK